MVDEAFRFTVLAILKEKTEDECEKVVRRHWFSRFGAPRIFRSDFESAFASDSFSIFLARYGTERELFKAVDSHSWMGILDRRVQLIRHMMPKLALELASEAISFENEDLVSETEYVLNTQLSYGGHCPYECLFGCLPNPLITDESEWLQQHGIDAGGFYEHSQVRARAIGQI